MGVRPDRTLMAKRKNKKDKAKARPQAQIAFAGEAAAESDFDAEQRASAAASVAALGAAAAKAAEEAKAQVEVEAAEQARKAREEEAAAAQAQAAQARIQAQAAQSAETDGPTAAEPSSVPTPQVQAAFEQPAVQQPEQIAVQQPQPVQQVQQVQAATEPQPQPQPIPIPIPAPQPILIQAQPGQQYRLQPQQPAALQPEQPADRPVAQQPQPEQLQQPGQPVAQQQQPEPQPQPEPERQPGQPAAQPQPQQPEQRSDSASASAQAAAESAADRAALREAVQAARESASVLAEAASALSASAAAASMPRIVQIPQMVVPQFQNDGGHPQLYAEGVLVESAQEGSGGDGSPALSEHVRHDADPAKAKRESEGYKPKEPGERKHVQFSKRDDRTHGRVRSTSAFVDESVLMSLPKFGDAPNPLPDPNEILASLPSLTNFGLTAAQAANLNGKSSVVHIPPEPEPEREPAPAPTMPTIKPFGSANAAQAQPAAQAATEPIPIPIPMPAPRQTADGDQAPVPYYGDIQPVPQPASQPTAQQPSSSSALTVELPIVRDQATEALVLPKGYGRRQGRGAYTQPGEGYDGYGSADAYDDYSEYYDEMTPYSMPAVKGGRATLSLIFGIFSILFSFIPPLGIIFAIVAILLARSYVKRGGTAPRGNTGRICGIAGLVLSVVILVAAGVFVAYFWGGLYGSANAGTIMGYLQTTPLAQYL